MNLSKCSKKLEWLIVLIMAWILFFFATYKLSETRQPIIYGDEFGYWANSSFFIGEDWSSAANNINYYSYGYSLLLIPIRLLARMWGWNHWQMFQAAIRMHAFMLVGSLLIVRKLCIRYLVDWHWFVRDLACFAAILYPPIIVYAHLTLTETALVFLLWVYFYVMMHVTDKPTIVNHIFFGMVAFYLYTIHQRCIAVVIASVIVILVLYVTKGNRLPQAAAFLGVLCISNMVHQCIKYKLQNDFYLAKNPLDWTAVFQFAWNKKTLLMLLVMFVFLLLFYLVEINPFHVERYKFLLLISAFAVGILCIFLIGNIDNLRDIAKNADARLATNDFAGQIAKVLSVFTPLGFLRLFVSMTGKWFYVATASGLMICFALLELVRRFVSALCNCAKTGCKNKGHLKDKRETYHRITAENIWFFGVFLTWLGMFGVCTLFMIDVWRVDNLVYGRYHETAAVFLFLYGFYVLDHDRKWLRHWCIFLLIYLVAAGICQNVLDRSGKDSFQMVHSIMLGRVFRDNEIPYRRVWESAGYAVAASAAICILLKRKLPDIKTIKAFLPHNIGNKIAKRANISFAILLAKKRKQRNEIKQKQQDVTLLKSKSRIMKQCITLFGVACIWGYMGIATVEDDVIPINKNIERSMLAIAESINKFSSENETIYYLRDTSGYRMGLVLQFYLPEKKVVFTTAQEMQPSKEAFYVTGVEFGSRNEVRNQFFSIAETPDFTLLVPYNGALFERFMEE